MTVGVRAKVRLYCVLLLRKHMRSFLASKKYWLIGILLVGAVAYVASTFFSNSVPEGIEIAAVERSEVQDIISETGSIEASQEVTLAFTSGGRVKAVLGATGMHVKQGDILIQLDSLQQSAELTSAYARLEAEQVRLKELQSGADQATLQVSEAGVEASVIAYENAERELEEVTAQQDVLLENAKATLRSSNLEAYLQTTEIQESESSYEAPRITGTYTSTEEGVYSVELYRSSAPSGYSFRTTGLEKFTGTVSSAKPTALGTRGLYIQFPEDFARSTHWEIPIPNTRSANYQANLNAYQAVVRTREVALTNAQNAVRSAKAALDQTELQYTQSADPARAEKIQAQRALVRQMEAGVASAEASYAETVLRAPFDGLITDLQVTAGELISPSVPVVSLISEEQFEVVVNITESDISGITIDDTAEVSLDAFDDVALQARVSSIAPRASIVDGVRVFEVKLRFVSKSDLLRSGLSADVDILADSRSMVLSVPSRAIVETPEGKFVRIYTHGKLERLPITTGLRGSNGLTEVTSGLQEGTMIVTVADSETRKELE